VSRAACARRLAAPAAAAITVAAVVVALAAPAGARAEGRASLVAGCLVMSGAGHATCRRRSLAAPTVAAAPRDGAGAGAAAGISDLGGAYPVYRLLGGFGEHRRCRLQPTCSLFAAQAARRLGILRGLLMGLARAQMSHSDQDGLLPAAVASDGEMIFFDPVERWIHGAP